MTFFKKIKLEFLKEVNRKVAVKATLLFGTMGAVYLFFIWSILPVLFPNIQPIVLYISSCVIQLVSLPLIMVGTNALSEKSELRAQQDHETIIKEFEIIKHMQKEADKERLQLKELNKNELKELQELSQLHIDLHKILNKTKKTKVKKIRD